MQPLQPAADEHLLLLAGVIGNTSCNSRLTVRDVSEKVQWKASTIIPIEGVGYTT